MLIKDGVMVCRLKFNERICALFTNNHSANLNVSNSITSLFVSNCSFFIEDPLRVTGDERIYSLAQSSIRDNLRNDEKFIFLEFVYDDQLPILLNCPPDYISWLDLPVKCDKVKALKINLRKSAKLSY